MNKREEKILETVKAFFSRAGMGFKAQAVEAMTLSYVARGVYHDNYRTALGEEEYLIRLNLSSQFGLSPEDQLRYEYHTLRDIASSSVTPTPVDLILCTRELGSPILIEEFIRGRPLVYETDLELVAESLAGIHRCTPKTNSLMAPVNVREALLTDGMKRLSTAEALGLKCESVMLLRSLGYKLLPNNSKSESRWLAIVHTDLNHSNFIVRSRCNIIDWESARFSGIEWDISHFVAKTTTMWDRRESCSLSEKQIDRFVTSYTECSGIKDRDRLSDLVRNTLPFVYFRCFAWCLSTYAEHLRGVIPPLKTNHLERLRYYSSPDFIQECMPAQV